MHLSGLEPADLSPLPQKGSSQAQTILDAPQELEGGWGKKLHLNSVTVFSGACLEAIYSFKNLLLKILGLYNASKEILQSWDPVKIPLSQFFLINNSLHQKGI